MSPKPGGLMIKMAGSLSGPFEVGLLCFGTEIPKAGVEEIVRAFEKSGDIFKIRRLRDPIVLPSIYDAAHCYSNSYYFGVLEYQAQAQGLDLIIGLTHESLEENKFNAHDEKRGVGIVTLFDSEKYKPTAMTVGKYLLYLVLCECFCLSGQEHFEHDRRLYDLFDECQNKEDLTKCLNEPRIHPETRKILNSAGFPPDAGEKLLRVVATKSALEIVKNFITHPNMGVAIGSMGVVFGVVTLLLPYNTSLDVRIWIIAAIVTPLPVLALFPWLISRIKRNRN